MKPTKIERYKEMKIFALEKPRIMKPFVHMLTHHYSLSRIFDGHKAAREKS